MTKVQAAAIAALKIELDGDAAKVEEILLFIAGKQTTDERYSGRTQYDNGVGFSGVDAHFGTSMADGIIRKRAMGVMAGQRLTERQLPYATKMAKKYAKQVVLSGYQFSVGE